MKYLVKMRNPATGKAEAYSTQAEDRADLQLGLDFWERDVGYVVLSVEEVPA